MKRLQKTCSEIPGLFYSELWTFAPCFLHRTSVLCMRLKRRMCQRHIMCWIALEMIGNRLKPLNCNSWSRCLNISIKGMLSLQEDPLWGKKGFKYLKQTGVYTSDACLDTWMFVSWERRTLTKTLLLSKHFKRTWKKHLKPASEVGLGWFSWFKLLFDLYLD